MDFNLSNAPWLSRRPENRGDAYYFSLDHTGVPAIDAVVGAIAWAGKCAHSTEDWTSEHIGWIDAAIKGAADELAAVTAQRDELIAAGEPVADALRDIAGDGHRVYLDAWESAIARAQPEQPKGEQ